MLVAHLPAAVSLNAMYIGKRRLSDRAKQWKVDARALIAHQGIAEDQKISGRFFASVIVHPKASGHEALDIDNTCKLMFDTLQADGFIENDKLINGLAVLPGEPKEHGGIVVGLMPESEFDPAQLIPICFGELL